MPGAIAILVALLVFPVLALMGTALIAVLLGHVLNRDGEQRHAGSELLDVNV